MRIITAKRKQSYFVIKSDNDWFETVVYNSDEIIKMGFPYVPDFGETLEIEVDE